MRLLIDECLSPALAREAQQSGIEAYHLAHVGRAGLRDASIVEFAVRQEMIFVTNNGNDFRRLYARQEVHPGLVIIVPNVERETQLRLFHAALLHLHAADDLINRALEIDLENNDVVLDEYGLFEYR